MPANNYIVQYASQMLSQGYSTDTVRKYLESQGYLAADIEASIGLAAERQSIAQQQYLQKIVIYIQQLLGKGYAQESIRSGLVSQGVSQAYIDQAFSIISRPAEKKAPRNAQKFFVLGSIVFVILFAFFGYNFIMQTFYSQRTLLDVTATLISDKIAPGDDLMFQLDMSNFGSQKRYDVNVEYSIIYEATGETINTKQETFAVETTLSRVRDMFVPGNAVEGLYILKVVANYDNKKAQSGFEFVVGKNITANITKPAANVTSKPGGVPRNATPQAPAEYELPAPKPEKINASNISPAARTISNAKEMAKSNPNGALQQCNSLEQADKDTCLGEIGKITKNKNTCIMIFDGAVRDSCYIYLYLNGDYSVCDLMIDDRQKEICNRFKELYS